MTQSHSTGCMLTMHVCVYMFIPGTFGQNCKKNVLSAYVPGCGLAVSTARLLYNILGAFLIYTFYLK